MPVQEQKSAVHGKPSDPAMLHKTKLAVLIGKQLDYTDPTPLNIYEVRNYIYFGFTDVELRPKYWKILLNYYSQNQFKCERFYRSSRQSYHEMLDNLNTKSDEVSSIVKQIELDIPRTAALQALPTSIRDEYILPLKQILTLNASTNKNIGYFQGSINILLVIYHALAQAHDVADSNFAEEDAFFLFNNLISEIGDNFSELHDELPSGIHTQINSILLIIESKDPELYIAMKQKGLCGSGFMVRWVLLLFSGEFPMDKLLFLWDRLLSDAHRFEMVNYCCAAAVILLRDVLLVSDFGKCMTVLQNISIIDVALLFNIADVMRRDAEANIVDHIKKKAGLSSARF